MDRSSAEVTNGCNPFASPGCPTVQETAAATPTTARRYTATKATILITANVREVTKAKTTAATTTTATTAKIRAAPTITKEATTALKESL